MGDWRAMGSNARRRMGAPSYHGGGAVPDGFAHVPDVVQAEVDKRAVKSGQSVRYQPGRTVDTSRRGPDGSYAERQGAAWTMWSPDDVQKYGRAEADTFVPGVEPSNDGYPLDVHDLQHTMPVDWDQSLDADYLHVEHGVVGPEGLGSRGWMPPQSGPPSERPWPQR